MVELKYIGAYQPENMIIDVDESQVDELLDSGEYNTLEIKKTIEVLKSPKKEVEDDDSKRIKKRF